MCKKYFKFLDCDAKIYENGINNFLPDRIIDLHVHLWKKEHIISKYKKPNNPFIDFNCFPEYTFKDFSAITRKIFRGKNYKGAFFGNPFKVLNLKRMNNYILNLAKKGEFCFYISSPEERLDNNIFGEMKSCKNFLGFKPYPKLFGEGIDIEINISDFLNNTVLEYANLYGLLIILHLPRKKRLADKKNIEEIKEITKKYPNIKYILAHSGRSYCLCDIYSVLDDIKDIKNLFFGLSFINDWEVFELILKNVDYKRIIFGSDMPASISRGKNICINNEHYFITENPYNWSISSNEMKLNFTFFIYEQIRELKKALYKCNITSDKIVQNIFHDNSKRLIESRE